MVELKKFILMEKYLKLKCLMNIIKRGKMVKDIKFWTFLKQKMAKKKAAKKKVAKKTTKKKAAKKKR